MDELYKEYGIAVRQAGFWTRRAKELEQQIDQAEQSKITEQKEELKEK